MKCKGEMTVIGNDGNRKRYAVRRQCAALFTAGMMLAGLFAALPLQAKETAETTIVPYAQEESVSGNDVPDFSEEAQRETSNETQSDKKQDKKAAEQPKKTQPTITAQPEDVCVEAGDCAYFNVSAVGEDLTYQWFVDKGDGSGFQKIMGAEASLYRVMVFDGEMNGYAYKCRVSEKISSGQPGSQESDGNNVQENSENYTESRAAKLTIFYRIVGGARSVWVKSSGRGLVFQGSGAYSKLNGVSVDGSRITAGEYNKGGSQTLFTEITLLRSYLETLAEGEHELEIVWEDGSAKTSFHITPPAANLPAESSGLGRPGGDAAGSSRAAGTTSAAGDAAAIMAGGQEEASKMADENAEEAEKAEEESGQISENTTDVSVSENTAADILGKAGIHADMQGDMTVTPGKRRTSRRASDFEKRPVQLAGMSQTVDQYAKKLCIVVILISITGIISGLIAYKLHDVEGGKK